MNLYPNQLRTILTYIDGLNAAEKVIIDGGDSEYDHGVQLTINLDIDGAHLGCLRDEIGGAWSYFPGERSS